MKTNKTIHLLALGLALALTATGCKHKTYTTPLGGAGAAAGSSTDVGSGVGVNGGGDSVKVGGGETAGLDEFEGMVPDRAALAAHTVHFAFDSAAIRDSEVANVQAVADALKSDASAKLLIEGHCDERGTEEYNRSLGERRALALREAVAKDGVDPGRIRTISYGEDRPVAPGHDEAAWSQNRRGEFVLLHPKGAS